MVVWRLGAEGRRVVQDERWIWLVEMGVGVMGVGMEVGGGVGFGAGGEDLQRVRFVKRFAGLTGDAGGDACVLLLVDACEGDGGGGGGGAALMIWRVSASRTS